MCNKFLTAGERDLNAMFTSSAIFPASSIVEWFEEVIHLLQYVLYTERSNNPFKSKCCLFTNIWLMLVASGSFCYFDVL